MDISRHICILFATTSPDIAFNFASLLPPLGKTKKKKSLAISFQQDDDTGFYILSRKSAKYHESVRRRADCPDEGKRDRYKTRDVPGSHTEKKQKTNT